MVSNLFFSRIPLSIIILWTIIVTIIYMYVIQQENDYFNKSLIEHDKLVDAVVLITAGKMAEKKTVDFTLSTIRRVGRWRGDIYILTDRPECFVDAIKLYSIKISKIPATSSIIDIKSYKMNIFPHLPENINSILYLDSDIIVSRNLNTFFKDISSQYQSIYPADKSSEGMSNRNQSNIFDMGLFKDAKGHFVGFCSGCDRWHTGVLWLYRNQGTRCLEGWEANLRSGKYNSDQESLDHAEAEGFCPQLLAFPTRHLIFAKDYIAMVLTSGRTFLHLTAISRMHTQDYLYREIVVPSIMRSLDPRLDKTSINKRKQC